jgi:hypothetical protein
LVALPGDDAPAAVVDVAAPGTVVDEPAAREIEVGIRRPTVPALLRLDPPLHPTRPMATTAVATTTAGESRRGGAAGRSCGPDARLTRPR